MLIIKEDLASLALSSSHENMPSVALLFVSALAVSSFLLISPALISALVSNLEFSSLRKLAFIGVLNGLLIGTFCAVSAVVATALHRRKMTKSEVFDAIPPWKFLYGVGAIVFLIKCRPFSRATSMPPFGLVGGPSPVEGAFFAFLWVAFIYLTKRTYGRLERRLSLNAGSQGIPDDRRNNSQ